MLPLKQIILIQPAPNHFEVIRTPDSCFLLSILILTTRPASVPQLQEGGVAFSSGHHDAVGHCPFVSILNTMRNGNFTTPLEEFFFHSKIYL